MELENSDFQTKLHIDESVQPIAQKLRPSPFGLRDKIEEKLEELVNHDIIEQISLNKWKAQPLGQAPLLWSLSSLGTSGFV